MTVDNFSTGKKKKERSKDALHTHTRQISVQGLQKQQRDTDNEIVESLGTAALCCLSTFLLQTARKKLGLVEERGFSPLLARFLSSRFSLCVISVPQHRSTGFLALRNLGAGEIKGSTGGEGLLAVHRLASGGLRPAEESSLVESCLFPLLCFLREEQEEERANPTTAASSST